MAKQVSIKDGTVFSSLSAAKDHYSKLREQTPVGHLVADPERSNLLDIYRRYRVATNWQPTDAIDVTAVMNNEKRPGGAYATTKALSIIDAAGTKHDFSIDKALAAIAI